MIKKLFFLVMIVSVMFGIVGVMGATTGSQNVTVIVSENIMVSITPSELDFGTISPGQTGPASNNITIDPSGSNANLMVDISIDSASIFSNIELKEPADTTWTAINSYPDIPFMCAGTPCTFTPSNKVLNARLNVPLGATTGLKTGKITYTITGTAPA